MLRGEGQEEGGCIDQLGKLFDKSDDCDCMQKVELAEKDCKKEKAH